MVSEIALRNSFNKIKKELSAVKAQNKRLNNSIKSLKKMMLTQQQIFDYAKQFFEKESAQFVEHDEFDSLVSKNPDVVYMLQHFYDLDDISITKKQYKYFNKKVDQLRQEAAELNSLKKFLVKKALLEKTVRRISRDLARIKSKLKRI
ncbi:hypothetical protein KY311_01210 [Candidatus Woesearchaeota archaeon]|nr:hypothetical protein [Candidatus Woesearchaeota archaeon]